MINSKKPTGEGQTTSLKSSTNNKEQTTSLKSSINNKEQATSLKSSTNKREQTTSLKSSTNNKEQTILRKQNSNCKEHATQQEHSTLQTPQTASQNLQNGQTILGNDSQADAQPPRTASQAGQFSPQTPRAVPWTKEQQRAISLRGKNIIVSASAGSGKTSVMIERAAELIAEGHSLSQMLIVTFTRAAAADIKDKLALRLTTSSDPHVRAQLKNLPCADIGTLHGFCQKLIQRYFYETGLDPDFAVLEEGERDIILSECMDRVVDEEYEAGRAEFLDFVDILGGRDEKNLSETLKEFYQKYILRSGEFVFDEGQCLPLLLEVYKKDFARLLRQAEELYDDLSAVGFDKKLPAAAELIEAIKQFSAPKSRLSGNIPEEFKPLNETLKSLRKKAGELAERRNNAINAPAPSNEYLFVLLRMAKRLFEVFSERKKSKARADFDDLEHHALSILKSGAGEEVRAAYKFVFVDEYQDINPVQNSIIDALRGQGNLFLVGDLKQSIYAFRGCDPSIFAEKIKEFEQAEDCEVIRLNANYRSDWGVLDFSNRLFSRIMTEDFGGTDYLRDGMFVKKSSEKEEEIDPNSDPATPDNCAVFDIKAGGKGFSPENNTYGKSGENAQQYTERNTVVDDNISNVKAGVKCFNNDISIAENAVDNSETDSPSVDDKYVNIYLYKKEKPVRTGIYNLLEDEGQGSDLTADLVAARILELLDKTITEKGKTRRVRLKDIAILCRSASDSAFALIAKLQKMGLATCPCEKLRVGGGAELAPLKEYLRLVNNQNSDTALIGSLKSSFGGFSDGELAQIRLAFPFAETFYAAAEAFASGRFYSPKLAANNADFSTNDKNNITNNIASNSENSGKDCQFEIMADSNDNGNYIFSDNRNNNGNDNYNDNEDNSNVEGALDNSEMDRGQTDENLHKKLAGFYKKLGYYRALSVRIPTSELIGKIVTDFEYFQQMFVLGGDAAARLEAFLNFAASKTETLPQFLDMIPAKQPVEGGESDAVSVITAHSAKGLEFPFVIILDAQKKFNTSDATDPIIVSGDLATIVNYDGESRTKRESAGWLLGSCRKRQLVCEEEMRLLYVALTRGKYGVDIFATKLDSGDYCAADEAKSWLDWLMPMADRHVRVINPVPDFAEKSAVFPPPDPSLARALADSFDFCPPSSTLPPKTYVTAVLDGDEGKIVLFADDKYGNPLGKKLATIQAEGAKTDTANINAAEGIADKADCAKGNEKCVNKKEDHAIERGVLYHKAMELVDFYADFDEEWKKLPAEIKADVDKDKIEAATKLVGGALGGFRLFKEQSFILDYDATEVGFDEQGSVLLQGVIDLMAIKNEANTQNNDIISTNADSDSAKAESNSASDYGDNSAQTNDKKDKWAMDLDGYDAVIVDYKTGLINTKYKKQLELYAHAAKKILGLKRIKTLIYSFEENRLFDSGLL